MRTIVLNSDDKSIVARLDSAVVTNELSFVATYALHGASFVEAVNDGVTNGITDVTIVPAPAVDTRAIIKDIVIHNNDTADVWLNLFFDNNGTQRLMHRVLLQAGDTFTLDAVFTSSGGVKGVSLNWGAIGGTLSDQTDLQSALDLKADAADNPEFVAVRNQTGATILANKFVKIVGGSGTRALIELADNTTDDEVAGITITDIPNNTDGTIQVFGTIEDLNTNGLTEGDIAWLDTAGGYTTTKPTGSAYLIKVGKIGVAHPTTGTLILNTPAFEVNSANSRYDNTTSGLTAVRVQDAIDELKTLIDSYHP